MMIKIRKKKDGTGIRLIRGVRRKRGSGISEERAKYLTRKAEMKRDDEFEKLIHKVINQNMFVFKYLDEH